MERIAVNVKEEDTVLVVATADGIINGGIIASVVANPIVVSDEIVSPIKVDKEMIMTTNDVEHVVVSKLAVVTNETAITVNATSNNPGVKEDQLYLSMASTKISTNEVDEIKHNLGEKVLDEQQKLETGVVEYLINVEGDNVVKEHFQDVIQEENVPDNESSSQQGVEPAAPAKPVVPPVTVDDDNNDPQYIPKSERFYEHDDRMAYSRTNSEGSESVSIYKEDSADDDGFDSGHRIRRRHTGTRKQKSVTPVTSTENTNLAVWNRTLSSKKVLAISQVADTIKNSETSVNANGLAKKLSVGSRKFHDLDVLDKWAHDMYDENEQTRKSDDELLAYYGYDIREELEAPRARRHHKYGRGATFKYTHSWQDTKDYTGTAGGQQSMKVKPGGKARRNVDGPNKNIKKYRTDKYTSELPAFDDTKKLKPTASNESPAIVEVSDQNYEQQPKNPSVQNEDKKSVDSVMETSEARHHTPPSRTTSKYYTTSPTNRNNRQDQQNNGPSSSLSSINTKNYFKQSPLKFGLINKKGARLNPDSPTTLANFNFFKRRAQQKSGSHNLHHNDKQQDIKNGQSGQGYNQQHQNSSLSVSRDRNFHQHHTSQQYNRGRYFSKGSTPLSSSSSNQYYYDQQYHSTPTTAGIESTKHGGGHYQNYNNRQHKYKNHQVEPSSLPTTVVRSSKRYSVQIHKELPDTILNFGGISKTPHSQPPAPQQQNSLVMEDQQMQPMPQELLQQQPPPPPPLQTQQYHQPLQQKHHGMVLNHSTGMKVMTTADSSMYHHRSAKNQNAAIYQLVPTGATGVTSLSSGTQSLQQQESFVTTTYQQQQLPQQQLPPKSVNLAMPIVAPAPDPNQQQGI